MKAHAYNFHESFVPRASAAVPSDRRFGITLALILAALGLLKSVFWSMAVGAVFIAGGGVFLALTFFAPAIMAKIKASFLRAAPVIARALNPLLMGFLFAVCFIPGGIALRLFRRDPLLREFDPYTVSYWKAREKHDLPDPMKYQF